MTADWTENTRALKLLVIGMTVLLVGGLVLLAVGMARTASKMSAELGDVPVSVPAGSSLIGVTADSGRLYLALRHGDGGQEVLVLDAASGRTLGRLDLAATP